MPRQETGLDRPHVLVVERDGDVRNALVEFVARTYPGAQVVAHARAESAAVAVDAGLRPTSAVLEDLPGTHNLVAALRAQGAMPAIVVTGWDDQHAGSRWGGWPVRFVTRPSTAAELAAELAAATEEVRGAGQTFMSSARDAEEATS